MKDKNRKKIDKLIAEGDELASKGRFDKAMKKFRKAHELDPDHEGLYDKLIEIHGKAVGEEKWDMKDFAEHIDLVMHKQEHDYPPIKQVHAKLSPEWKQVSDLVIRILDEDDDQKAGPLIEDLVSKGEIATRALIDLLRVMKKGTQENVEGSVPFEDT